MGTFRLFTGADGQSHFETVDLAQTPDWTKGLATTRISFRTDPVGHFIDWHPAPRRQFVIILSGQLEIGLGDGTKRVFGAGDASDGRSHSPLEAHHLPASRLACRTVRRH